MSEPGGNKDKSLSTSFSVEVVDEKPQPESVKVSVNGVEVTISKGNDLEIKQRSSNGTHVFTYIVHVDSFIYDVKTGVIRGISAYLWNKNKKEKDGWWNSYAQAWYFGDMDSLKKTKSPTSS